MPNSQAFSGFWNRGKGQNIFTSNIISSSSYSSSMMINSFILSCQHGCYWQFFLLKYIMSDLKRSFVFLIQVESMSAGRRFSLDFGSLLESDRPRLFGWSHTRIWTPAQASFLKLNGWFLSISSNHLPVCATAKHLTTCCRFCRGQLKRQSNMGPSSISWSWNVLF